MQGFRFSASFQLLIMAAGLAACTAAPPPRTEQAALADWGRPSARHRLDDGTQRLEYATGPMGRTTWMLDLGPKGEVIRAEQVLTEAGLSEAQAALPMPAQALLQRLGRPGERRHGGWPGGEVWSWRYPTYQCLWFQVSVADNGTALSGAFLPDPRCEVDDDNQ